MSIANSDLLKRRCPRCREPHAPLTLCETCASEVSRASGWLSLMPWIMPRRADPNASRPRKDSGSGASVVFIGNVCVKCEGKVRYSRGSGCAICSVAGHKQKTNERKREQRDDIYRRRGYFDLFPGETLSEKGCSA